MYFKGIMYVSRSKQQMNFESQFFGNPFPIPDNDPYLMIECMIDWEDLLPDLRKLYHIRGKASIPVKNLVLLLLYKHYDNCSDVEIVEKLAGSLPMQKALNITFMEAQIRTRNEIYSKKHKKKDIKIRGYINPSTLSRFRSRLGAEGVAKITALCDRNVKKEQKSRTVVVDTTVSPADIAYPTDIGLLEKARQITLNYIKDISKIIDKKYRTYSQTARKTFLNYIVPSVR